MSKTKKLVLGSLLLAVLIVVERLLGVQTPILRVSFAYVPITLSAVLLGPVWSALVAGLGDLIGALLFPKGLFFPGFTLSSFLTGLIYGLFVYNPRSDKGFLRGLIISNLLILVFIRNGLTSFWIALTTGNAYKVFVPARVISSLIMFPVQISTMYLLKKFLDKPIRRYLREEDPYGGESRESGEAGNSPGGEARKENGLG
jgi:ECF transporter S component (folate family)